MKRYVYIMTVTGSLPFPTDMLRYDRCTPKTEIDSLAINRSHEIPAGKTTLRVMSDGRPARWAPTEGRWESFGWKILDVTREEDKS